MMKILAWWKFGKFYGLEANCNFCVASLYVYDKFAVVSSLVHLKICLKSSDMTFDFFLVLPMTFY